MTDSLEFIASQMFFASWDDLAASEVSFRYLMRNVNRTTTEPAEIAALIAMTESSSRLKVTKGVIGRDIRIRYHSITIFLTSASTTETTSLDSTSSRLRGVFEISSKSLRKSSILSIASRSAKRSV